MCFPSQGGVCLLGFNFRHFTWTSWFCFWMVENSHSLLKRIPFSKFSSGKLFPVFILLDIFFIFYFYFLVKLEIKLKIVLVFLLLFVLAFCVLYLDFHELGFCYFIISPSSSLFIFFPCFRLCPCIGFQHLFFPFTNISILFIHARELGIKH